MWARQTSPNANVRVTLNVPITNQLEYLLGQDIYRRACFEYRCWNRLCSCRKFQQHCRSDEEKFPFIRWCHVMGRIPGIWYVLEMHASLRVEIRA